MTTLREKYQELFDTLFIGEDSEFNKPLNELYNLCVELLRRLEVAEGALKEELSSWQWRLSLREAYKKRIGSLENTLATITADYKEGE